MGIAIRTLHQGGVSRPQDMTAGLADNQTSGLEGYPAPPVISNPRIMGGKPYIGGTRMPIDWVFQFFEHGYTLEQFLDLYPQYQRDQIQTAIRYAIEKMGYPAVELA